MYITYKNLENGAIVKDFVLSKKVFADEIQYITINGTIFVGEEYWLVPSKFDNEIKIEFMIEEK